MPAVISSWCLPQSTPQSVHCIGEQQVVLLNIISGPGDRADPELMLINCLLKNLGKGWKLQALHRVKVNVQSQSARISFVFLRRVFYVSWASSCLSSG